MTDSSQLEREVFGTLETYQKLWETTTDSVLIIDQNNIIQYANRSTKDVFGYSPEEIVGKNLEIMQPERFREKHSNGLKEYIKTGIKTVNWRGKEGVGLHRDGYEFPIELSYTELIMNDQVLFGGFIRDITSRKEQEDRISRLTRIYAVLSQINSTIVRIHDRQKLFEEVCRIAVTEGEFGMVWIGLLEPETMAVKPVAYDGFHQSLDHLMQINRSARSDLAEGQGTVGRAIREKEPVICNNIRADMDVGAMRKEALKFGYHSVISLPLQLEGKSIGVFVLFAKAIDFFDEEELRLLTELANDISFALEYITKAEQANYLAYYDVLTGLSNRTMFLERLGQYVQVSKQRGEKLAVLTLNLDRFRQINETLGRKAGDELIRQVARRLKDIVTDSNQLAHIGADEFTILQTNIKYVDEIAWSIETRIMNVFAEPFLLKGEEVRISTKAGIALFPDDGTDADTLFHKSEVALKRAKTSGQTYLFFTSEMTEAITGKMELENQLRRAVIKEEFVLYYQPIFAADTGEITKLEALIRWQHPERGLIPPNQFIPLLEETGLILDVGRWVFKKVASDSRLWKSQQLFNKRISINISALQLYEDDFVENIKVDICDHYEECYIDLEITESLIMDDVEKNIEKLLALKDIGSMISVDDFGTGYSSLRYIAKLPVDTLKIDRSFITNMTENPEDMMIVSTIINLGHNLSLNLIAEGVETELQAKFLRLLKCDEIQGYLYSKPLPADEIVKLLKK